MAGRRLEELAAFIGGEVLGDGSLTISGVNGLAEAGPTELSFFGNARYRKALETTKAAAVLINGERPARADLSYVRVGNPHLAFAKLSALFHPRASFAPGVHARAHVDAGARVDATATVMAGAVVEKGASVGPRTVLFPHAYLGEGARVGADGLLYPGATVRENCVVGDRVILHANCVIGADGFGFALDLEKPEHFKIPQAGIVRIEDDVEVGACSCVDRATLGETVVGRGTKIDNLVQVAHNVRIGPLSILCAQVGISGSTDVGQGVVLAGQVGVVGHVRIGDLAKIGAQSGVSNDVPDGATVSGYPAIEHRAWLKNSAAINQLPEVLKELRLLRKKVEALEKSAGG